MHKQRQVPSSLAAHWGYVLIACLRHNGPGITDKYTMTEAMGLAGGGRGGRGQGKGKGGQGNGNGQQTRQRKRDGSCLATL